MKIVMEFLHYLALILGVTVAVTMKRKTEMRSIESMSVIELQCMRYTALITPLMNTIPMKMMMIGTVKMRKMKMFGPQMMVRQRRFQLLLLVGMREPEAVTAMRVVTPVLLL
jgi:hypothetical protein